MCAFPHVWDTPFKLRICSNFFPQFALCLTARKQRYLFLLKKASTTPLPCRFSALHWNLDWQGKTSGQWVPFVKVLFHSLPYNLAIYRRLRKNKEVKWAHSKKVFVKVCGQLQGLETNFRALLLPKCSCGDNAI